MSNNMHISLDALFAQARMQPQPPPIHEVLNRIAENSSKDLVISRWFRWVGIGAIVALLLWILLYATYQHSPDGNNNASTIQSQQNNNAGTTDVHKGVSHLGHSQKQNQNIDEDSVKQGTHPSPLVNTHQPEFNVELPDNFQDYALLFNGRNTFVEVSSSAGFEPESTLTVEAWVKVENSGDKIQPLLCKQFSETQLPGNSYSLSLGNHDGSGRKHWVFSISNGTSNSETTVISPKEFVPGAWTHIAGTYNGRQMVLYINGSLVASVAKTGAIGYDTLPLRFGTFQHEQPEKTAFLKGQLDEIRVWTTVRSAEEIKTAMHQKLSSTESGLAAYWGCNEGAGNTVADIQNRFTGYLFPNYRKTQGGVQWVKSSVVFHNRTQ